MGALGICTSPKGVLGCKSPTCPGGNINNNLSAIRSGVLDEESLKSTWNAIASDLTGLFPHEQQEITVTFNEYEASCLNDTPVANDSYLAEIYGRLYAKDAEVKRIDNWIEQAKEKLNPSHRFYRASSIDSINASIESYESKKALAKKEYDSIFQETLPYDKKWKDAGCWSRAFLVTNGNGHVHKNMNCPTCYSTTEFVWLPQYSGQNEDLLIEDAGSRICTVCYPNAPVDYSNRASRIESPEDKLKRIERETEKKAKLAATEAKSISMPDGSPLKNRYGVIKTERTAEIEAVGAMEMVLGYEAKGQPLNPSAEAEYRKDYENIVKALAFKRGTTEEEQRKIILEKANKKIKKW